MESITININTKSGNVDLKQKTLNNDEYNSLKTYLNNDNTKKSISNNILLYYLDEGEYDTFNCLGDNIEKMNIELGKFMNECGVECDMDFN